MPAGECTDIIGLLFTYISRHGRVLNSWLSWLMLIASNNRNAWQMILISFLRKISKHCVFFNVQPMFVGRVIALLSTAVIGLRGCAFN